MSHLGNRVAEGFTTVVRRGGAIPERTETASRLDYATKGGFFRPMRPGTARVAARQCLGEMKAHAADGWVLKDPARQGAGSVRRLSATRPR